MKRSKYKYLIIHEKEVKKYLDRLKLNKLKVIFFGSDLFVIPVLEALEDNFEVPAVVTASDSAVANYFKGPIFTSNLPLAEQISSFKPDLFVVASFGKIISQPILNIPKFGALNVHPSLLPKYRGPSPVPATILNGDRKSGITIIKMDELIDHGAIVAIKEISLSGKETFHELINKLFQLGAKLLVEIIPDFVAGKFTLKPQNHSKATLTKPLTRQDGYIDIDNPPSSEKLDRMIRAYYPWPGVWTSWKGKIVKFLPGGLLQMEGKKAITLKDFLNGYPDFPLKMVL